MVHYTDARPLKIENVDLPIHLFGIQGHTIFICFGVFVSSLSVNVFIAIINFVLMGVASRMFFLSEMSGYPYPFSAFWLKATKKVRLLKNVFPSLDGVIYANEVYRGS